MSPELLMALMTAAIVAAGLFSIVGALRRTANRPAPGVDSGGDGGPILGSPHHGRDCRGHDNADGGDDGGGGD